MSTPSDKTLRLERTKLTPQAPKGRNTTLIMAVVAGLAAAVLAYVVITQQKPANNNNNQVSVVKVPPKVSVYYASKEIPMRSLITPDMIKTQEIEPDKVPTQACKSINEIVNKTAKISIKADSVLTIDLVDDPTLLGITGRIQYPYRAMTIALDPQSSVAGFIKPNDRVDIIGTFTVGNQSVSRTILQNIVLLATGKQYLPPAAAMAPKNDGTLLNNGNNNNNNNNNEQPGLSSAPVEVPNATVMVTQVEAEKLVLAANQGKLMLTLRPANDNAKIPVPDINSTAVTGKVASTTNAAPPPPPPPPPVLPGNRSTVPPAMPMMQPKPVAVTVIRGSEIHQVPVGM